MSLQIKICGITRPQDAALAAELGATHVGCILTPEAPHRVAAAQAKEIFQAAGKRVKKVLVFSTADPKTVLEAARQTGTTLVQLAGYREDEVKALEKAGLTVYRVHEVPTGANMLPPLNPEPSETSPAILQAAAVGTGLTFPWEILGSEAPWGTFISGGVRPENICALLTHHPFGVNLSSGVESSPGIKDPDRLALFFDALESGRG